MLVPLGTRRYPPTADAEEGARRTDDLRGPVFLARHDLRTRAKLRSDRGDAHGLAEDLAPVVLAQPHGSLCLLRARRCRALRDDHDHVRAHRLDLARNLGAGTTAQ